MAGTTATYDDLSELLGAVAALQLCTDFGGGELYVPNLTEANGTHAIVQSVGMEAALKLAREYAGERIEVPMAKKHRRAAILAAVAERRMSVQKAAKELGLTTRWVRELVNGDARQIDMFD